MLRSSLAPLAKGDIRGGMGYGCGAGYAYHLNNQISLWTGLEVNSYSGHSYVGSISESSTVNIADKWSNEFQMPTPEISKQFEFKANVQGYTVKQSAMYLQVPMLFGYENKLSGTGWLTWYSRGGLKLGYSLYGTSEAEAESLSLSGDFPSFGYLLDDDTKDVLGFGAYTKEEQDHLLHQQTSLNLGFSSVGYLELGVKQKLAQQYSLYMGLFGEYSLYSAIAGATSENMYKYEPSSVSESANLYSIKYTPASHTAHNRSKKFYPMSFGITVRFSFDTKRPAPVNNRMLQMRFLDF
jgi:hypothetical protein